MLRLFQYSISKFVVGCLVLLNFLSVAMAANCRTSLTIKTIDVSTLSTAERIKLIDEYSLQVAQTRELFEAASQIASRIPGVTFTGVTMGDVSVRRIERNQSSTPLWSVKYEGKGAISFGVSNKRSAREEKYAELTFARNELSWLEFQRSSLRRSDSQYESLTRRMNFARSRAEEIRRQL